MIPLRPAFVVVALVFAAQPGPVPDPLYCQGRIVGKNYALSFEKGSWDLTRDDQKALAEAAKDVVHMPLIQLLMRWEPEPADVSKRRGLNVRRMISIQAELVKNGVSRSAISVGGTGFLHAMPQVEPCEAERSMTHRIVITMRL